LISFHLPKQKADRIGSKTGWSWWPGLFRGAPAVVVSSQEPTAKLKILKSRVVTRILSGPALSQVGRTLGTTLQCPLEFRRDAGGLEGHILVTATLFTCQIACGFRWAGSVSAPSRPRYQESGILQTS